MKNSEKNKPNLISLMKQSDLILTFSLFGIVLLLVLPIPATLLDLLLAMSIGISLLILLIVVYVKDPSEFSVFPTILLSITLFRLGLNVASTRLILLDGYSGKVIETFGETVVGGNYVVGAVVFLILVIINFVVITKGSGRIAEVAARFTLDAMPGKQMAIDAELNAGIIDEAQATKRRLKVQTEADFYGSMDGASKFVRGDAVAGILITLINVIGGISIGTLQKGLPLSEALAKFTLLSIGDGLVSQIPSLIVSVAAGILVTRTSENTDLGSNLTKQIIVYPKALGVAGSMLMFFSIIPGMPIIPFILLGSACGYGAFTLNKRKKRLLELPSSGSHTLDSNGEPTEESESTSSNQSTPTPEGATKESFSDLIQTERFAVELSYGLVSIAEKKQGGELLERITGLRQKLAQELGMIIPPVAVRDNLELATNEYVFKLRGKQVSRFILMPNRWMAMNVSNSKEPLKGISTIEPVFGLEAVWITEDERKNAEMNGYTVIDEVSVLITHLSEVLKTQAARILEREDVQKLIDVVKEKNPTLIKELMPDIANVGLVQRILQNLLQENISIRNLSIILETIADYGTVSKNPDELSEQVRKRLGIYFIEKYEAEPSLVKALTLDPRLEQSLVTRVKKTQFDVGLMMDPQTTDHLIKELQPRLQEMGEQGIDPIVVTTSELRLPFKRFFEPSFKRLSVLAYQEIPDQVQIQNYGIITIPQNDESPKPSQSVNPANEIAEQLV